MNLTYIVLIICVALCLLMFFYLSWYVKRRTSAAGLIPEYRNEVYRLIAEIDAATDRDSRLVEERIKKLKEILDEADKRLAVYVKELEKSKAGEALYTQLGRGIKSALNTEIDTIQISNSAAPKLSTVRPNVEASGQIYAPPTQQTLPLDSVATAVPVVPRKKAAEQKPPSKRQIRAHIDILINEGLPPEQIAKQLGISIAEVELAMQLRRM